MLTFLLALACAPPTPDAYAVGVANLVGRTLVDAAARVLVATEDPGIRWEEALAHDGMVRAPTGLRGLFEPWVGAFDLRLAPGNDDAWNVALDGEDVRVRRFDDRGCWDMTCADLGLELDTSLHGGCAIDWDPPDYTFGLALEGAVEFPRGGPPPEREDYSADNAGYWAWSDDGGHDGVAFALRAQGTVDGSPAEVVAHYHEATYSGLLTVQVTIDGQNTPEVLCGWSD